MEPRAEVCARQILLSPGAAYVVRWAGFWMLAGGIRATGNGGAERNRTADLLIANEALSQLSYGPGARAQNAPKAAY